MALRLPTPSKPKTHKESLNQSAQNPDVQTLIKDYLQSYADQNLQPLLDSEGKFTGGYYDKAIGPPADAPDQPSAERYNFHVQYLEQKYGRPFQPVPGQEIPEFNPVDPFTSTGPVNSLVNMARSAYPSTLTGEAEKYTKGLFGVDNPQANAFGLIDPHKAGAFQPNKVEQALTPLVGFAEDLPAMVGIAAATEGAGLPAAATRIGLGASKVVEGLGGASRAALTAQRLGTLATGSAANFGSYEFAKGFFSGQPIDEALKRGAKGAALGALIPIAGAAGEGMAGAVSQPTLRKLAEFTLPATGEVAAFGGLGPLLEGRTPEAQDFLSAAGFILGIKTAGKIAEVGTRGWNRAVAAKAAKLEAAAGGSKDPGKFVMDQIERTFYESSDFNAGGDKGILTKARAAAESDKPETVIGTLGDFIVNPRLRADFAPVLDHQIVVSDKIPADPNAGEGSLRAGTIGYRGAKPAIIINKDAPEFFGGSIIHEAQHWMSIGKGREGGEAQAEKAVTYATSGKLNTSEKSVKAAELAARRGWGRTVGNAADKEFTLDELPKVEGKPNPITTLTKGDEPQSVRFVTLETGKDAKGSVSKAIYGPGREGATIGVFKAGKDKTVASILDVGSSPESAVKLVKEAKAQADRKGENIYLRTSAVDAEQVKALSDAGLIGKAKSGRYQISRLEQPTIAKKLPTPKPSEPIKVEAPETPKTSRELLPRNLGEAMKPLKEQAIKMAQERVAKSKNIGDFLSAQRELERKKSLPFRTVTRAVPSAKAKAEELGIADNRTILDKVGDVYQKGVAPLRRASNRVSSPEGKSGMQMHRDNRAYGAMYEGKFIDEIRKTGVAELKPEQRSGKEAIKAAQPFFAAIYPYLKKYKGDLGKVLGEYVPRMIKRDVLDEWRDDILKIGKALRDKDISMEDVAKMGNETILKAALSKISESGRKNIQYLLSSGQVKNLGQAIESFSKDTQRQFYGEPGFLKSRTLSYTPGVYETDMLYIMNQYAKKSAKWVAAQEAYGPGLKKFNDLMGKLYDKGDPDAEILAKTMEMLSGEYDYRHGLSGTARKLTDVFSAGETAFKIGLGFSAIKNVSQTLISTIPDLGVMNAIRGGYDLFNPEVRHALRLSGVEAYMDEKVLMAQLGYDPGGAMGKFSHLITTGSGFTGINRFNAMLAGATARRAMLEWVELAKQGGRKGEWAKGRLSELGVDWKKPLGEEQIARGMFEFASKSQLQKNVIDEPFLINEPMWRPFTLFKRFGVKQAYYMSDMLISQAKQGNVMPIIRLAAGGALGGAASLWAINHIKSIVSGQPVYEKDDTMFEAITSNLGAIGAMGVLTDVIAIDKLSSLPRTGKFLLEPVLFSDLNSVADAWTKVMGDWDKYGDAWLAVKRNAPDIVSPLGSFPRLAAKRLETGSQVTNEDKAGKNRERDEIFNLILQGNGEAASRRIQKWNEAHKRDGAKVQLSMNDVSTSAMRKYVENKAKSYAEQFGTKGTRAYVAAQTKRRLQLMQHIQQGQ